MRQRHLLVAAFVALGALTAAACQPVAPPPPPVGPTCSAAPGSTIPGQWVATVDPDGPAPTEAVTFEATTPAAKDAKVADLESDGTVLMVEPDRVVVALDTVTPGNDPSYATLQQAALTEAGFPGAWTAGFGGSGATIAILDSGVNAGQEDLQARVLPGADFVSGTAPEGTSNFARVDPYGHGTHVAGIAAASDNAAGGIGGAPLASILPVRVLNSCGSGSFSAVAAGIRWAAQHGANVISMSLGGGSTCAGDLANAVQEARDLGVLVVAAAGNSNTSTVGSPASCAGVIAVGASELSNSAAQRADFSNYGVDVDIAAPGRTIYSTYIPGSASYTTLSGTSMSTPFVSAAAALVYQHCLAQLPGPSQARGDKLAQILLASEGPVVPSRLAHSLRIRAAGGTYTLTYASTQTTAPLASGATAAQVRGALEALPAIGVGNVDVVSVTPTAGESARFDITLKGAAASNAAFGVDASALTAGVALSAIQTSSGTTSQTASVSAASGTYTLTFDSATTAAIAFNATATQVDAALEALGTIGLAGVAVTGVAGGPFTIAFGGALAGNTTRLITGDGAALGAGASSITPPPFPGRLNAAAAVAASCV